jgi:hypothetical protein
VLPCRVGPPSTINLWNERGEYVATFAAPGEGPGELSPRGALSMHVDAQDRLRVRDGGPYWSVFSPDQIFVRRVSAAVMGGIQGQTVILDDGRALTGQHMPSHRTHHFLIVDSTGVLDRGLAPMDPQLVAAVPYTERVVAYAGGETFWAGPPVYGNGHSPDGYSLEEWTTDGELLRKFTRVTSWFPVSWPPPAPQPEGGMMDRPAMRVAGLHVDSTGLLLVIAVGASPQWPEMTYRDFSELSEDEQYGTYQVTVEAIDTHGGVVLSSDTYNGIQALELVGGLIPRTRLGARYELDENLLPLVRIIEYELLSR